MLTNILDIPLKPGQTVTVFDTIQAVAGTASVRFAIQAETILVSEWVDATSGSVDVVVTTQHSDNTESTSVITFPTINAPTTEIVLRKAAAVMQYITITATWTAACQFTVKARGVSSGLASVTILGSNVAKNYITTMTPTPTLIIPVALDGREGIALHNTAASQKVYMSFTLANCNPTVGWEIGPGEKLGLDIAGGVTLYGMVVAGSEVVKVLEAGS